MNYTYDGTFFGFLSAVFDGWQDGVNQIEEIMPQEESSLFGDTVHTITDDRKAYRILQALQQQCGGKTSHFLYYAFLAEMPHREIWLLRYLRLAFQYRQEFLYHLSDEPLWTVRQWARKTGNERHSLLGLLRFQELPTGLLYSRLKPTCCVVPLMAPHFVRRLHHEEWMIHDAGRHMGVYYDRHHAVIVEVPAAAPRVAVSTDEAAMQRLWKQYYRTIAIEARRNENLRRQFMPKKYWPYLIELNPSGIAGDNKTGKR
ncbi:MAG: TIGR03915 family putative DNA repair protein [Megasphaera sp.]|jgi:probable DNA metabolism protein|nr:TIGR03915 family putative DNA repair protein [Megasphaera sp.]